MKILRFYQEFGVVKHEFVQSSDNIAVVPALDIIFDYQPCNILKHS